MRSPLREKKYPPLDISGQRPPKAWLTARRRQEVDALLHSLDRAEGEIVRAYRRAFTVPYALAFELESLGDEAMAGHEEKVRARYQDVLRRANVHRQDGAEATRAAFRPRADAVTEKNALLLARVARGTLTEHGAATKIHADWSERGIGARPSLITLRRWVARALKKS